MKIAIVTGATSGIGKSIAHKLIKNGFYVFGVGRNIDKSETHNNLEWLYMDITNNESVTKAIDYIIEKKSKIDVLINNAGVGCVAPLETVTEKMAKEVFEINFFGLINVCQNVIPYMRTNKYGYIINISSIGGVLGLPFQGIYSASKFSVEGLTESMSMELMQFGINCVLIEPGDYNTNIYKNRKVSTDKNSPYYKYVEQISRAMTKAVNNGNNPDEIGDLVVKILKKRNPKLRYTTGEFTQRLTTVVKKLIPGRFFEKIIMNHYKIPEKI